MKNINNRMKNINNKMKYQNENIELKIKCQNIEL